MIHDKDIKGNNELKYKADLFTESIKQEYVKFMKESSILTKFGLLSIGALLIYYLVSNNFKSTKEKIGDRKHSNDIFKDNESIAGKEISLKNQFNDKITIIGLEILRQMLILIIGKLKINDEKKDL